MVSTTIAAAEWLQRARDLRGEGWWLADLAGLDLSAHSRLRPAEERFHVVCQLLNHKTKERQTVHVVAEAENPSIPSVSEVWPTADFMEREAYDLFGINFEGHPNLTRILLPDEWEGHPLRKDYGVGKVAIEFVPQPYIQTDSPGQSPKPGEAGSATDRLGQTESGS